MQERGIKKSEVMRDNRPARLRRIPRLHRGDIPGQKQPENTLDGDFPLGKSLCNYLCDFLGGEGFGPCAPGGGSRFLAVANSAVAPLPHAPAPGAGELRLCGSAGIGGDLSKVGSWKWEVGSGMASRSGSESPWSSLQWHHQRKKKGRGGESVINTEGGAGTLKKKKIPGVTHDVTAPTARRRRRRRRRSEARGWGPGSAPRAGGCFLLGAVTSPVPASPSPRRVPNPHREGCDRGRIHPCRLLENPHPSAWKPKE